MNALHRLAARIAVAALPVATALATLVPGVSMAGVGQITLPDFSGSWVATLQGVTGCGPTSMHVQISMNNAGVGTATTTAHGQCGDSTTSGLAFRIQTLNTNGSGTANLSCGAGCGWNLRFQMSPDRQVMNLVDVDPVNPGNYIAGVAVHY